MTATLPGGSLDRSRSQEPKPTQLPRAAAALPTGRRERPVRRSWGLITLAALLVVASGLAVATWGLHAGDRTSVVGIGHDIAKGDQIRRSDLVSVSVAGLSNTVPIDDLDEVVGQSAATDLVTGQVLTAGQLTDSVQPVAGESTVGLALAQNRTPLGLGPGDLVDVIAVSPPEAATAGTSLELPEVLAAGAEVVAVDGTSAVDGQLVLTVLVDADTAARVAAFSAQDLTAVTKVSSGSGSLDDEDGGP